MRQYAPITLASYGPNLGACRLTSGFRLIPLVATDEDDLNSSYTRASVPIRKRNITLCIRYGFAGAGVVMRP